MHDSVADELLRRLRQAYASAPIGNPLDAGTLVGPLIDRASYDAMQSALKAAVEQGGKVTGGERALAEQYPDAWYVRPAIAEMPGQTDVVCHETFAPILYVIRYTDFAQALALNNAVPQGLSSAIFTNDLREAETFLSASARTAASPTSTSAPRAPRSAARSAARRKPAAAANRARTRGATTRRATNTINYSRQLPLAQGIKFGEWRAGRPGAVSMPT